MMQLRTSVLFIVFFFTLFTVNSENQEITENKSISLEGTWSLYGAASPLRFTAVERTVKNNKYKYLLFHNFEASEKIAFYEIKGNQILFSVKTDTDKTIEKFVWKIIDNQENKLTIQQIKNSKITEQIWTKEPEFPYEVSPKDKALDGIWNLETEINVQGNKSYELNKYLSNPENYPKYNQYDTGEGGFFIPQLFISQKTDPKTKELFYTLSSTYGEFNGNFDITKIMQDVQGTFLKFKLQNTDNQSDKYIWYILRSDDVLILHDHTQPFVIKVYKQED